MIMKQWGLYTKRMCFFFRCHTHTHTPSTLSIILSLKPQQYTIPPGTNTYFLFFLTSAFSFFFPSSFFSLCKPNILTHLGHSPPFLCLCPPLTPILLYCVTNGVADARENSVIMRAKKMNCFIFYFLKGGGKGECCVCIIMISDMMQSHIFRCQPGPFSTV